MSEKLEFKCAKMASENRKLKVKTKSDLLQRSRIDILSLLRMHFRKLFTVIFGQK